MVSERVAQLRALVNSGGFGLEIGPSHNPIFPKREGFNVETLDYADQETLIAKYRQQGIDTSTIEPVDYVSSGAPLDEVISRRHEYDFVFSSHAIEHVTDFVSYFRSCEALLKPGGVIAMAVPDKRYTFDVMRPASTTGQVLEAFYRKQTRHSPAGTYDFIADFATLDGREVWTRHDTGSLAFRHAIDGAKALLEDTLRPDGPYHDVHGWVFTPSSFRLILHDLRTLGLVHVEEAHMTEIGGLEFHVALAAGAAGNGLDRMQLQKQLARENLILSLQILAPDDERCRRILDEI